MREWTLWSRAVISCNKQSTWMSLWQKMHTCSMYVNSKAMRLVPFHIREQKRNNNCMRVACM